MSVVALEPALGRPVKGKDSEGSRREQKEKQDHERNEIQGSTKRGTPDLVNFDPAEAYHFCIHATWGLLF